MEARASPSRPINIRRIRSSLSLSDDEDLRDETIRDDTEVFTKSQNEENTSKSLPDRVREIIPSSGVGSTVYSVIRLHVAIIPKHNYSPNIPHIGTLVSGTQTVIQVPRLLPEPLEIIKTIIFDGNSSIRQCIETIINKISVSNQSSDIDKYRQEYIDYGLYNTRIGWLDEDELLDELKITEHDLLEFRQQYRKLQVLINTPQKEPSNSLTIVPSQCEFTSIDISEKNKVGDAIKNIVDAIGISKTFGRHQFNPEEVVEVDKDSYLLHLPLPPHTQFVVICKTVQISYSISFPSLQTNNNNTSFHADNIPVPPFNKDNYGLYFVVPFHNGVMFKLPGHAKLYNKWRKRFFILNKGKLSYYRHDNTENPSHNTSGSSTNNSGPSSTTTTTTSSDKSTAEEHKVMLQQFVLQQPINFISIQSVDSISVVAKPFDNTSKKLFWYAFYILDSPVSFEMFTNRKSYYFGTESVEEGQLWLQKLTEWVTFSKVFGPSTAPSTKTRKKPSDAIHDVLPVQVNVSGVTRRLSARMNKAIELVRKGSFGSKSQGHLPHNNQAPTTPVSTSPKPERVFVEIPKHTETRVLFRTLTVELRDGSRKLVTVNESLDVYDLVEVIVKEIGTENSHFMTFLDQGDQRKVELLDHSMPLSAQHLPLSAVFLIKKTGIAQAETIQDNHFLYVQLPLIDGFVLKYYQTQSSSDTDKVVDASTDPNNNNNNNWTPHQTHHTTMLSEDFGLWQKQWMVLRSNKLFFFDYETSTQYNDLMELYNIQSIAETTAPEHHIKHLAEKLKSLPQLLPRKSTTLATSTLNCEDCGLEIKTKKQTFFLMAKTKQQRDALVVTLNQWKNFFTDDGTRLTAKPSVPSMFVDFNSFFANNNPTMFQPVFYDLDTPVTFQRRKSLSKQDSPNFASQNNNNANSADGVVFRSPLIDDTRSNSSRRKLTNAPHYPTSIIANLQ